MDGNRRPSIACLCLCLVLDLDLVLTIRIPFLVLYLVEVQTVFRQAQVSAFRLQEDVRLCEKFTVYMYCTHVYTVLYRHAVVGTRVQRCFAGTTQSTAG